MTLEDNKSQTTRKTCLWSCLIVLVVFCLSLPIIKIVFNMMVNSSFDYLESLSDEEMRRLPSRDTVAYYKDGKYQIVHYTNDHFGLCDQDSSSFQPIVDNVKKWKYTTIRSSLFHSIEYLCVIDKENRYYILNMDTGDLQGPLSLEEIPQEFVRVCKSL